MKRVMFGAVLGGISVFAGVQFGSIDRSCPDLDVVAYWAPRCVDGDAAACVALDRNVPASCLLRRAREAVQPMQVEPSVELEMVL